MFLINLLLLPHQSQSNIARSSTPIACSFPCTICCENPKWSGYDFLSAVQLENVTMKGFDSRIKYNIVFLFAFNTKQFFVEHAFTNHAAWGFIARGHLLGNSPENNKLHQSNANFVFAKKVSSAEAATSIYTFWIREPLTIEMPMRWKKAYLKDSNCSNSHTMQLSYNCFFFRFASVSWM